VIIGLAILRHVHFPHLKSCQPGCSIVNVKIIVSPYGIDANNYLVTLPLNLGEVVHPSQGAGSQEKNTQKKYKKKITRF
jgi:hypothetical protein